MALVHVKSWQSAYRGLIPDEVLDELSVDERTAMWERASARGEVWVGLDGDEVVGFICTGPSREPDATSQLYAIYLLPSAWGTGLALPLAEAGLAGLTDVVLWVLEDNRRARSFYERLGFTMDGKTREETFGSVVVKELRYRR